MVRRLAAGDTPREVDRWYQAECGESADIEHVLAALDELGFIATPEQAPVDLAPVRWQRLGAALFPVPAWIGYGALVAWAVVAMVRSPDLVPNYCNLFFTDYLTLVQPRVDVLRVQFEHPVEIARLDQELEPGEQLPPSSRRPRSSWYPPL
ncbi:hypothetical protein [Micromonospora sp. NPDC048830]|uniref:hypothetical protein n=1 Tax=Micromonospora sp. NPDC048830 TaxID=3364257 RepID=UPI00370FD735